MFTQLLAFLAVLPFAFVTSQSYWFEEREQRSDAKKQLEQLKRNYRDYTERTFNEKCNADNIIRRREWGDMPADELLDYINATLCLQTHPSLTSLQFAPGVRNRRDDFTVIHMANHTRIHLASDFFHYHRWFLWVYERVLRKECGYKGALPYMAYERYGYIDLDKTPMLDNSSTSLGTNGSQPKDGYLGEHRCLCIQGPLASIVVGLGPADPGRGCIPNPQADGLGYNPRCIERNFQSGPKPNFTYEHIYETLMAPPDFGEFAQRIDAWPGGVHPEGHGLVGGAQNDVPSSCNDPYFYAHHAGMDYLWAVWQSIDPDNRVDAFPPSEVYAKERSLRKWPPDKQANKDTLLDLGLALPHIRAGQVASPTLGAICVIYE